VKEPATGDRGCVKVLWSLFDKALLFKTVPSVSLSKSCFVWEFLFAFLSLELAFVQLLSLLPHSLLFLVVQGDNKESTLNEILCFRNTGVASVLLLVQESDVVPADGEDVDGSQFLVLIAWVMIIWL
jgi:hypothetical protein